MASDDLCVCMCVHYIFKMVLEHQAGVPFTRGGKYGKWEPEGEESQCISREKLWKYGYHGLEGSSVGEVLTLRTQDLSSSETAFKNKKAGQRDMCLSYYPCPVGP